MHCRSCKRALDDTSLFAKNCGGGCRLCMARSGDADETQAILAALPAEAFALKKSSGMKLGQCYEAIAKAQGFKTYAAMRASLGA